LRRIMVLLLIAAVMVAIGATAGPAMAQVEDKAAAKAAKKAERQAAKQAKRAQNPGAQNPGAQKQLPATGGIPTSTVVVLGTGALLVGAGLMVRRAVRH
jgi:LPXTG-motif cell wall-anchored protein